ncbi:DNA-binding transcriptional LysR family regulator [Pseudoduganella flava]|uniref:DNA-binding transcriptional LysR family regulator n=1 Tax=Pseudoduganella flava TaxID=871742 RepID=A0A562PCP9_9BURK|nr:LysR family transcriptional regulator [Pseudoduganella flava]QGZ40074.1 LysR family transcriptional regulator [Pseudoduganella flava]TWI42178.1 DNA-binding transcriptional LysR family regulator [Pseudoduganella flava]
MTLEQLRVFVAVAERGHLTQAADALALTPSAVSASIRALEERYDTPLFDRVGRRIELNGAGRLFLDEARATLARAGAAERALAELAGLQRGALALQASQTIASYWLPPLLVRFRQAYPHVAVRLEVGNTVSVADAVRAGAADMGFIEGEVADDALEAVPVGADSMAVVVAPGHPWARKRAMKAADLASGEWVVREPGSGTRSAFEAMLAQLGVAPAGLTVALTLPSNEAVRAAVMTGRYAAGLSELVAAPYVAAGLLARARLQLPPRPFYLLRHRERHRSKAALALAQLVGPAA